MGTWGSRNPVRRRVYALRGVEMYAKRFMRLATGVNENEYPSEERELISNYRESSPEWQKNIAMTAKLAAGDSKQE